MANDISQPGSRTLPLWRGIFILLWGIGLELVVLSPRVGLWLVALIAVSIAVVASRWRSRMSRFARAMLVLWVCAATIVTLLVAAGPVFRQLMIAVSMVALGLTLAAESQSENPKLHGRIAAVAIFFVLLSSYFSLVTFGSGIFLVISPWWLAALASGVTVGLAALGWTASDVPWRTYARGLPLAALFGAELMLVTWWLPTAIYVGSIIGATITSLWIQTTRHVWLGDWEAGRGRRYVLIGASTIIAVLATARWI